MKYVYRTSPEVCSDSIEMEISGAGEISAVKFIGGCPGSLQAVSRLVIGRRPGEVVKLLRGIPCGGKRTSCPDQLASVLSKLLKEHPQWQE